MSDQTQLLLNMARDWTDPAVVRDAPERVPHVIEQLIAEIERLQATLSASGAGVDYPPSPEAFLQQRQPSTHHADIRAYTYAEVLDVMHAYALTVRTAGVDPSQDLATAFAEKFPQQDLPADAATVFLENYRALVNEDPPAGVDRHTSIVQQMREAAKTFAGVPPDRVRAWADQLAGVGRPQPCAPDDVMDIYVPGAWKCPTCGFALAQATLFVGSGEIGCTLDQVMKLSGELCPNDGAAMHRVTWRDRAIENQAWGESLMHEIIAAVGADHLPAALARIKELAGVGVAPPPAKP